MLDSVLDSFQRNAMELDLEIRVAKLSPTEEFLITDPESQPDVVLEVEPGVRPLQLLEPYSAAIDVHCAFCSQRQRHRHGYLALLPDGRRALCGNICAEEFFDKQTVNTLDRKRERLASARRRQQVSDAIVGTAEKLLPIIDKEIAPNEWEAEAAMLELGRHLSPAVRVLIKESNVGGVAFLGQPCRAFADARGGIACILQKVDKMTDREAEQLLAKRVAVIDRIKYGTRYLQEAAAFFERSNLVRFCEWMRANKERHDITEIRLAKKRLIVIRRHEWSHIDLPEIKAPDIEKVMLTLGWQQT